MPLVDVATAAETSGETVSITHGLLAKIGKKPVLCRKIISGYILNAFNSAIISAALNLVQQGVASKEDIDTAFTAALGPRLSVMGPFQIMDMIGLDLMCEAAGAGSTLEIFAPVKELIDAGHYGVKTARGFYDYSPKTPDEVRRDIEEKLFTVLKGALKEAWGR